MIHQNLIDQKQSRFQQRRRRSQSGFIAADYLFSFIISMGLFMILFAITFTLSVTEIAQYIAFSSARSFAAAHKDRTFQEGLARNKFSELKKNPVFDPLFTNWFDLTIESVKGGADSGQTYTADYDDFADGVRRAPAVGIRLLFTSKILSQKNSLLGSTGGEEGGFQAKVTGIMMREPSAEECLNQMKREQRYRAILQLDAARYNIMGAINQAKYVGIEDNGC